MRGWILYGKQEEELNQAEDYGVLRLLAAAARKNIVLSVYTPEQFELVVGEDDAKSILVKEVPVTLPDFILPRMGVETTYFALAIIRHLEQLGVYSCNSARSVEIVRDKLQMSQVFARHRLPTPKTMFLKFPIHVDIVEQRIGFPLVIKNITGSEGKGVYLCDSPEHFIDLMELMCGANPNANIILQEFIEESCGRDLRVFVLGGKVIGCMKRCSENGFKANYSRGGTVENFPITPEIEWLTTATARVLNLEVAGIDLLFDKKGYKICEANSAPGFEGMEEVVGETIAEQILDYITVKIRGYICADL